MQESPTGPEGWAPSPAIGDNRLGTATAPVMNMPVWSNRLIGRDSDRDRLRALLIDEGYRLVVITGPGGIGKTRLAAQVATDLQDRFRDGSRFLAFASVPRHADLDAALARLLGLRDEQHRSHRESIGRHLQLREMLLVVDNVEHIARIAGLLRYIQNRCASVAMIVTSRSTLDIYGEVVHQVNPLPHRATRSLLQGTSPAGVTHSPAVELFRERARAVAPDFEITGDNAADVAAICDHLGGLPLAIELTAPRVADRTPARLLADLEASLADPPARPASAHAPVMSMQDTLRLSYDLLDDDTREVFRTLCIMCGHWTIDDVLPIMPPGIDELEAIDLLDALVARSMISSPSAPDEDVRFTINPVLRHFGRNLLAAEGEADIVASRHADRMIRLAEEAQPELTGPGQRWWLTRIESLHNDFREAHAHLREVGRAVDGLRLSAALWRFGYTRGHYREARQMIEISLAEVDGEDALRCHALNGLGMIANVMHDTDGARAAHQQALAIATALELNREIAVSRIGLADIEATVANDTASALRHLDHAAGAYERLHDARGIASVLTNRGYIEWQLGQLDQAFTTHEEARVLYAQVSDTRGIAWSDMNTGRIATQQGRYHEAVPRLLAGLDGYVQIGDVTGVSEALEAFAAVAAGTGDLDTASVLLGAAATLRASVGSMLSGVDRAEVDETLAAARAGSSHAEAYARGERLSPEEAIAIARSFPVPERQEEAAGPNAPALARERFGITPREHEVLLLLGEGMTDQQIADRLGIGIRTVQTYTTALMRKLEVSSRVSAVRAAHQAGIGPTRRR